MINSIKTGNFIAERRKTLEFTQQQLADNLHISFQAVSKWETGTSYPNVELLYDLSVLLDVTVEEILLGELRPADTYSYSKAGVDISYTDAIKKEISKHMHTHDSRVLNGLGPFASLYDIHFPDIQNPVLVLKSEEPGSKQKLAMEFGFTESICHDMINHLVNDIVVMGAKPLAVLDTIVCGNAEKDTISTLVKGMSDACQSNECSLVGGETSIQPQVIDKGVYILTASIAGIAERSRLIDGTAIREGDIVLALASNGLHTNGYSLIRLLMERMPQIKLSKIEHQTFLEQIMKPHLPYYPAIKELLGADVLHGMAHITGGGIEGNLCRVIPDTLSAEIDLAKIRPLPIFPFIKAAGNISDMEMLRTFNCGVGFNVIVTPKDAPAVQKHLSKFYHCYEIGVIKSGTQRVHFENKIDWML